MHLTLEQETAQSPAANRRAQQRAFDLYVRSSTKCAPHDALDMRTPAAVYQPSPRKFPTRLPEVEYHREHAEYVQWGTRGRFAGRSTRFSLVKFFGVSEQDCCRSMIAATGSTMHR